MPKHDAGIITESNDTETVYYGICKCGFKTKKLRYREVDAFDDIAAHLQMILEADWRRDKALKGDDVRVNVSEDGDNYPNDAALWWANIRRSFKSKRGQSALCELRDALEALPEKVLLADELIDAEGDVCALGALGLKRGLADEMRTIDPEDEGSMIDFGIRLGFSRSASWAIVYQDDECNDNWVDGKRVAETPQQRHARMLAWVKGHIVDASK